MRSWTESWTLPENMDKRFRSAPRAVALGGVLAAVAVVLMTLGGAIPIATYAIPMLCAMILYYVLMFCGSRIAWAWYGAVAILGLLLGPDKEAAAIFLTIGYYPILKPVFDKTPVKWLLKGLFFNISILAMYWVMIHLFGLSGLSTEFEGVGRISLVLMLAMGNLIFFMLDKALAKHWRRRKKRHE